VVVPTRGGVPSRGVRTRRSSTPMIESRSACGWSCGRHTEVSAAQQALEVRRRWHPLKSGRLSGINQVSGGSLASSSSPYAMRHRHRQGPRRAHRRRSRTPATAGITVTTTVPEHPVRHRGPRRTYYNTEPEVERAVDVIAALTRSRQSRVGCRIDAAVSAGRWRFVEPRPSIPNYMELPSPTGRYGHE
jgi:hypothetical protein